jgi:hypothetical protein
MYSDIKIDVKNNWQLNIHAATGKHAMRELSNEQIVLLAILTWLFAPKNLSRRAEYAWLVSFLPQWADASVSGLLKALEQISEKTLDRYINAASSAELTLPNGRKDMLANYFRRNDTVAMHVFGSYNDVIGNDWVHNALAPVASINEAVSARATSNVQTVAYQGVLPAGAKVSISNHVISNHGDSAFSINVGPSPHGDMIQDFAYEKINNLGHQKDEEAVPRTTAVPRTMRGSSEQIGMIDEVNFMPPSATKVQRKNIWQKFKEFITPQ